MSASNSPRHPQSSSSPRPLVDALRDMVARFYKNGLLLNDDFELERLQAKAERAEIELVASASLEALAAAAPEAGVVYGTKVYPLPEGFDERLREKVTQTLDSGARLIYYALLREELSDTLPYWVDEGFLRQRLRRTATSSSKAYVVRFDDDAYLRAESRFAAHTDPSEDELVAAEIVRVWGDSKVVSFDELRAKLPCVPEENLKRALKRDEFIPNAKNEFTRYDLVEFDHDALKKTRQTVSNAMIYKKFFPLPKLPLGKTPVLNEELSEIAIQRALYKKTLADRFDLSGKLIVAKGETVSTTDAGIAYCLAKDRVTVNEVLEYAKEIAGTFTVQSAVNIVFKSMVRISEHSFVNKELIHFDIEKVDQALSDIFKKNEYIPVQWFTTFATFPECGYQWNQCLLEGFVCHFSREFDLVVHSYNIKNLGVIARKSRSFETLDEIIDHAVGQSRCVLEKQSVLEWLKSNGYLYSVHYTRIDTVIKNARCYREGNN